MKIRKKSLILLFAIMFLVVNCGNIGTTSVSASNTYNSIQYAHYGNNTFALQAQFTYDDNGVYTYGSVRNIGNKYNLYEPYFSIISTSYSFNSSKTKCTVTIKGSMVDSGIGTLITKTLRMTFTAGGGDLYLGTYV